MCIMIRGWGTEEDSDVIHQPVTRLSFLFLPQITHSWTRELYLSVNKNIAYFLLIKISFILIFMS